MPTIRNLSIRNQADGRVLPIDAIESDVTVSELIGAYKGQMGISSDHGVKMKRKATGKELMSSLTIEQAGVQDNETLLVEMDYVAG